MRGPLHRDASGPALGSALAAALVFTLLAIAVDLGRLTAADTHGILEIRAYASPPMTGLMQAASFVANGRVAIPVALLTAVLVYAFVTPRDAAVYAIACIGGEIALLATKALVHHHRPVGISPKLTDAGWYSFPSGHVMLAVIIWGLGAFMLTGGASRLVRAVALSLASVGVLLVGWSRVYLGAHWPSDVIGAILAGFALAAMCLGLDRRLASGGRP